MAGVLDLAIPAALAAPGGLSEIFVLHDELCPLLGGGACACSPVVTAGYVLWFRKGRRAKWEKVATAATRSAAFAAVAASGKRNGDWCVLEATRAP